MTRLLNEAQCEKLLQGLAAGMGEMTVGDAQRLLDWADGIAVGWALVENVLSGMAVVTGFGPDGEPLFSITDAGSKRAKELLGATP